MISGRIQDSSARQPPDIETFPLCCILPWTTDPHPWQATRHVASEELNRAIRQIQVLSTERDGCLEREKALTAQLERALMDGRTARLELDNAQQKQDLKSEVERLKQLLDERDAEYVALAASTVIGYFLPHTQPPFSPPSLSHVPSTLPPLLPLLKLPSTRRPTPPLPSEFSRVLAQSLSTDSTETETT